jgi:hypothetical protein
MNYQMTEIEPFSKQRVFQVRRTKCTGSNVNLCNEPAISLRESRKIPQHNTQFRVLVSRNVTKAHVVAVVRARYHKTGARIVNLKKKLLLSPAGESKFSKQLSG